MFTRSRGYNYQPKIYPLDGLNTLRYKLVEHEARPLYTWLHVVLPPHPSYFKGSYRAPVSVAHWCQTGTKLVAFLVILSMTYLCLVVTSVW